MISITKELYRRSRILTLFGALSILGVICCLIMILTTRIELLGINAWIKPLKFYLSTVIFVWSISWYLGYLKRTILIAYFEWTVVLTLTFELCWITWKASHGEISHFNISSAFNGIMFSLMGIAISIMTLFTMVIGILFFSRPFPNLSNSYLWGIRLGIMLFVIFAFEGGIMAATLSHTVGASDGGEGISLFNWSLSHGDLRVAHFMGMHALQVLPILGFYIIKSRIGIISISAFYAGVAFWLLVQALKGISFLNF